MAALTWERWNRSKGCRYGMDEKFFAGKSFSSIFWSAMRLVFYDEHSKPGLLYQGTLYPLGEKIIALNGRRWGFSEQDEIAMLKLGNFHYYEANIFFPPLLVSGPDPEDRDHNWAKAYGIANVDINFYDILKSALTGLGFVKPVTLPENEVGLRIITYFTAGIVLHEIMHNHGFHHQGSADLNMGSDYASSLPCVAEMAVYSACPEWLLLQAALTNGYPSGGFGCCGTQPPPPAPPTRQSGWRWCKKCEGMFFGEFSGSDGKCPAGGGHDKSGSGNYSVVINSPADPGQHFWRWCNKCQGMFYGGHGAGRCPAGGGHDSYGSGDYSLMQNVGAFGGQNNWRWCNRCQALFFAGHGPGVCPVGGGHDQTGSGDYTVPIVG
jgi:hypothetical protein